MIPLIFSLIPIFMIIVATCILLSTFIRVIVCTFCRILLLFISPLLLCFISVLSCLVIGSPISIAGFTVTSIITLLFCAILILFIPITILFLPETLTILLCILMLNAIFFSGSCPCIFLPISLIPGGLWYIVTQLLVILLTPLSWIWKLIILLLLIITERCISTPIQVSLIIIIVCNILIVTTPGCMCPYILPFSLCYNLTTSPVFICIWFITFSLINTLVSYISCVFLILISLVKPSIDICLLSLIIFLIAYLFIGIPNLIIWCLLIPIQIICIWPELLLFTPICSCYVLSFSVILFPAICTSVIVYLIILSISLCILCELFIICLIWQIAIVFVIFLCCITNLGFCYLTTGCIISIFIIPYLIWSIISCLISSITIFPILYCLLPSIPCSYLLLLLIYCSSPILIPLLSCVLIILAQISCICIICTVPILLVVSPPIIYPIDPIRVILISRMHQLFADRISFKARGIEKLFSFGKKQEEK